MGHGVHARIHATCLLGLALLALSFAGCGSGSSTAGPGSTASATSTAGAATGGSDSRSRFVARADAACKRINAEILAIKSRHTTAAEIKRVVPHTLSIERKALGELAALTPPASIASDWRRMLGYRRTLAGELAQLLALAKQNGGTSIEPLVVSKRRTHRALSKTATGAGFKDCSKIGSV